jgi:hypothetical protein
MQNEEVERELRVWLASSEKITEDLLCAKINGGDCL